MQQNNEYVQTNDRISGFGLSRFGAGGVVYIDGSRKPTKATATATTTAAAATVRTTEPPALPPPQPSSPSQSPPSPPSPPFFLIDTGSNAVDTNQESSPAEPKIKILRQEQEETADGYHFV